jgi:hypothetical protein
VVLSDQIKSLDWKGRDAEFIIKASVQELSEVIEKLSVLIFEPDPAHQDEVSETT